jgi:hypothetical protein
MVPLEEEPTEVAGTDENREHSLGEAEFVLELALPLLHVAHGIGTPPAAVLGREEEPVGLRGVRVEVGDAALLADGAPAILFVGATQILGVEELLQAPARGAVVGTAVDAQEELPRIGDADLVEDAEETQVVVVRLHGDVAARLEAVTPIL